MISFIITALMLGCQATGTPIDVVKEPVPRLTINQSGNLYNFNPKNLVELNERLKQTAKQRVHIIQLGDSHTAADVFTGAIRKQLQKKYGDGGIGFIPAADIKGIRSDLVTINTDSSSWQVLTSRKEESPIFPLGGYQVNTKNAAGNIQIKARGNYVSNLTNYAVKVLYHTGKTQQARVNKSPLTLPGSNSSWHWSDTIKNVNLPINISINSGSGFSIGGVFLTSAKQNGLVFSTLGINGATATYWDKWHVSWYDSLKTLSPQMVILAYGTNEAYDATLDIKQYEADLSKRISKLKKLMPNTVFLLMGPPDSMKTKGPMASNACESVYANHLNAIIQVQKKLAKQHQILFWDWQAAMGGTCSIKTWQQKVLAKDDLVHLTAEGYQLSAELFVKDFTKLLSEINRQ